MKILKNQKELKKYREQLLNKQDYLDPITGAKITNASLDHSHSTGFCRKVLSREANLFLGKLENAYIRYIKWKYPDLSLSQLLNNIIIYLEQDYTGNYYHPGYLKTMVNKFKRLEVKFQILVLKEAGIEPGKNLLIRAKQYKKLIINENS